MIGECSLHFLEKEAVSILKQPLGVFRFYDIPDLSPDY
jgi:hypothetical protein